MVSCRTACWVLVVLALLLCKDMVAGFGRASAFCYCIGSTQNRPSVLLRMSTAVADDQPLTGDFEGGGLVEGSAPPISFTRPHPSSALDLGTGPQALDAAAEADARAEAPAESIDEQDDETHQAVVRRRITWSANVKSTVRVKEINRSAQDYMALPASQYSVLSADQIERIGDAQFKAVLGKMNFFGTVFIPTLYVDVNVLPEEHRAEIIVQRAETTGSALAEEISGTFTISALNNVSAGKDDKGRSTLTSDTSLVIDVLVPEGAKVPLRLIKSGGNFIIQSSLNLIVPTFVRILAADFARWSAGDDSRKAVEGATL